MQAAQGHSRKASDDFAKLFFENDSENLDVVGELNFQMDPTLMEPPLSFQQPKSSFTYIVLTYISFPRFFNQIFKLYVHPAGAFLVILAAVVIPVCLGYVVVRQNLKDKGEFLIIDKSFDSFQIPGHISSQHKDMVDLASKQSKETGIPQRRSRRKRSATEFQENKKQTLELVYLAIGEDDSELNVFTKERLETIHQIEQSLMQQENFPDFCWKWSEARKKDHFLPYNCTPPISLIDFFFPSVIGEFRIYDGQSKGREKENLTEESIAKSLELLLTKPFTYWFVDDSFSKDNRKSRFLRAEIKFGFPLKPTYGSSKKQWNEAFETFLVKYVEAVKKMSTE